MHPRLRAATLWFGFVIAAGLLASALLFPERTGIMLEPIGSPGLTQVALTKRANRFTRHRTLIVRSAGVLAVLIVLYGLWLWTLPSMGSGPGICDGTPWVCAPDLFTAPPR